MIQEKFKAPKPISMLATESSIALIGKCMGDAKRGIIVSQKSQTSRVTFFGQNIKNAIRVLKS